MLDAAIKNSAIQNLIDYNLSIEDIGIFKPDPKVYQLASVQSGEIIFQSSNAWDAAGASAFGLNVAWVNRFGQSEERLPGKPDFEIQTLIGLPDLIN
jgi:2-haloacid dehalogenase